ncbi:MAG: polysaccharide biosynthesis tyrosine autokinase [Chitinivibrionales bacterium]|nr:polysaccharide biosynthesis tyrosine autokinase [Chitinivibrionales bacterium]
MDSTSQTSVRPLYAQPSSQPAKKSLQRHLEAFRRGKWLLAGVFVFVFCAVAAYTFIVPASYEAYCLLLVGGEQAPGQSAAGDALSFHTIERPAFGSRNLANQTIILKQSLLLARRTAKRLAGLKTAPQTGEPLTILSRRGKELSTTDIALRLQEEYVTVRRADKDVDVIQIVATSRAAGEAATIANIYAEEYVKLAHETSRQHITASRTFLEKQIEQRRAELADLENRIKQYRSREGAVALDEASQYTISQIAQLEAELDEARIDKSMHEASLASLQEELAQLQPVLANRVASGVEVEIEQAQRTIAELELLVERIYQRNPGLRENPSGNTELADLTRRISQLKQRVKQLSEQYVEEILAVGGVDPKSEREGLSYITQLNRKVVEERIAVSGAGAKITALKQRLEAYGRKLESIPQQAMQLAQLERSRQSAERLYTHLVEKLQEARIAEESEVGTAQIIRTALAPQRPERPKKVKNLALGALLGLLLGTGAAFVRQRLDTRIYTPDDLRDKGMTLLGALPDLHDAIRRECKGEEYVSYQGRHLSSTLVSLYNPSSPEAETLRRLHMALLPPNANAPFKSLLITSPEEGTGKSTTALNLAVTIATAGRRTVIVDADLFRPTLHRFLDLAPGPGLDAIVRSNDHTAACTPTGIDNLFAVLSPHPITHAGDFFGSAGMTEWVTRLKAGYDFVIFDAPPVLVATDAAFLSAHCGATVFVVRSGATDMEALEQAASELARAGAISKGVVLNRFEPSRIYGYKFTYGYMYTDHTQSIPKI